MTKTNISMTFPYLLHNPLGNMITPFRAVTHLPSSLESPIPGNPSLGKASSHRKINNQGIYLQQNHNIGHIILMEINGNYWVLVYHNGLALEVIYQHTVVSSNFALLMLPILVADFHHSTRHVHAFLFQAHNFHYI